MCGCSHIAIFWAPAKLKALWEKEEEGSERSFRVATRKRSLTDFPTTQRSKTEFVTTSGVQGLRPWASLVSFYIVNITLTVCLSSTSCSALCMSSTGITWE